MSEKGSGKIPGGKLLAQYVGKVMIAHYKSINEGPRAKLQIQLDLLRKNGGAQLNNDTKWCQECGVINSIRYFHYCSIHKAYYCKGCLQGPDEERICPMCITSCDYNYDYEKKDLPRCEIWTDGKTFCNDCESDLCVNHRQYCSDCGKAYCLPGINSEGKRIDCFDKHSCPQGRKRAKH